ncbi:Inherit from ascNOG: Methyltransferase [Seminavis robusta]|uniref:Inherit from ascNOG: Methyltransferase n=1 Tax=Seminavis robusta TaxID=568900 RepID=A0A9N8HAV6_9STRA|nr:Inherit from ascNOG: Methyltransferase [Seminavis robusta]|eukprot:Sro311_g114370.1 Inherit from ascNOG: Methyltransferase (307) ;mRNA; f:59328-60248
MTFESTTKLAPLNYISPLVQERILIGLGSSSSARTIQTLLVPKPKKIRNGRASQFHLKEDGFELLQGISRPDYATLQRPRDRFYATRELVVPLATKLVRDRFGLTPFYAHFTPPYLRRQTAASSLDTRDHSSGATPHAMVHNDYAWDSYQNMKSISDYFGLPRDSPRLGKVVQSFQRAGRVIVLQFWMNAQPEDTVIENDTLALCHPRSIQTPDLVARRVTGYNNSQYEFTILQAKDSPTHEWFYWPALGFKECLVWVGYDSAWGDDVKPCFHTSFHDSTVPKGRPRESVEARVIVFLDEKLQSRL